MILELFRAKLLALLQNHTSQKTSIKGHSCSVLRIRSLGRKRLPVNVLTNRPDIFHHALRDQIHSSRSCKVTLHNPMTLAPTIAKRENER